MKQYTDYLLNFLEKPTIECADVIELAGHYVDGELPTTLEGRYEEKLNSCKNCGGFMLTYKKTLDLAQELEPLPVPQEIHERLMKALALRLGLNSDA